MERDLEAEAHEIGRNPAMVSYVAANTARARAPGMVFLVVADRQRVNVDVVPEQAAVAAVARLVVEDGKTDPNLKGTPIEDVARKGISAPRLAGALRFVFYIRGEGWIVLNEPANRVPR